MRKEQFAADADKGNRKDAAQPEVGYMLGADCAEVSTDEKARSQQRSHSNVRVTLAVVLDKSEKAHRQKQRSQRSTLGLVLVHAKQPDERGHKENAAADAYNAGSDAHNQANQ